MEQGWIHPDWRARLEAAGLDTLQAALAYQDGEFVSVHSRRGRTSRAVLGDGTAVFVKTDNFTYFKQVCKDLWRLRKPTPNSVKERAAYDWLSARGFTVPQVIAWWRRTTLGYPGAAAMITLPVPGRPLDTLVKERGAAACAAEIAAVEAVWRRMMEAGCDWPDHKPEHFFVTPELSVGMIDLERMEVLAQPLSEAEIAARLAHFRSMAVNGTRK